MFFRSWRKQATTLSVIAASLGTFVVGCSESTLVRRDLSEGQRLAPVNVFVTIPLGVTVAESGPYRYLAKKIQRDHPFAAVAYDRERWPLTLELVYRSGPKASAFEVMKMVLAAGTLFLVPIPQTRVHRLHVNVFEVSAHGRTPRGEVEYEAEDTKVMWMPFALIGDSESEGIDRLLKQFYNDLYVHKAVPTIDELRNQRSGKPAT